MARPARESAATPLNLTPIMSVMVILIPVLLLLFNFHEVTVHAVAAPKTTTRPTHTATLPLNLTVLIGQRGFILTQQAEHGTASQTIPQVVADGVEGYDFAGLYSTLMEVKRAFPEETTLHLAADFDIPWSVIARTIDAARLQLAKPAYETLSDYANAAPKPGNSPLFPRVVFTVADR